MGEGGREEHICILIRDGDLSSPPPRPLAQRAAAAEAHALHGPVEGVREIQYLPWPGRDGKT